MTPWNGRRNESCIEADALKITSDNRQQASVITDAVLAELYFGGPMADGQTQAARKMWARGQSQFYERDFAREQAEGLAALCNDEAQESGEHVVQHWEDTSESEAEFEARVAGLVNAPAIAA